MISVQRLSHTKVLSLCVQTPLAASHIPWPPNSSSTWPHPARLHSYLLSFSWLLLFFWEYLAGIYIYIYTRLGHWQNAFQWLSATWLNRQRAICVRPATAETCGKEQLKSPIGPCNSHSRQAQWLRAHAWSNDLLPSIDKAEKGSVGIVVGFEKIHLGRWHCPTNCKNASKPALGFDSDHRWAKTLVHC